MKSETNYTIFGIASALVLAACGSSGSTSSPTRISAETTEHSPLHSSEAEGHDLHERPVVEPELVLVEPSLVADLMRVEMAAYQRARPVFEEQCGGCHVPDPTRKKIKKAVAHFSMASYPFHGHHQGELGQAIRVVIGGAGTPATMPKDDPGSMKGDDLKVLLAWADAFDAAREAGVGYHATNIEQAERDTKKHKHGDAHQDGKKHEH